MTLGTVYLLFGPDDTWKSDFIDALADSGKELDARKYRVFCRVIDDPTMFRFFSTYIMSDDTERAVLVVLSAKADTDELLAYALCSKAFFRNAKVVTARQSDILRPSYDAFTWDYAILPQKVALDELRGIHAA